MKVAVVCEQGRRHSMEDTYFLDMNFEGRGWIFGGVYDGHSGQEAASYLAHFLHRRFLQALLTTNSPCRAFVQSYEQISDELRQQTSGACAANFFLRDNEIWFANAGDANILVIGAQQARQLSTEHRLRNHAEQQRIIEAGGEIMPPYVWKNNVGGLMPTRTIGDQPFKSVGVIATPAVGSYRIAHDDLFLIAATDGLSDVMSTEEVIIMARDYREPDQLAKALQREVLINRYGDDNLTIIVLAFAE
jgi:serine/threonine protein phosphatase PrpC